MGTRYLTAAYANGECKIAQYGMYDGDPQNAGVEILRILSESDKDQLKEAISKCKFYTKEQADEIKSMDSDIKNKEYPHMDGAVGCKILTMVLYNLTNVVENELELMKVKEFLWAYVIDFDSRTFEIYKGINREPLEVSERFVFHGELLDGREDMHFARCIEVFDLDELPQEDAFLDRINWRLQVINM